MKDLLKNPKKQIVLIIVLLVGYWSYDIVFDEKHIPMSIDSVEEVTDELQDTVVVETIPEAVQRQMEPIESTPPEVEVEREEPKPTVQSRENETQSITQEYEYKIQFWNMIFGHLASILGSLASLLIPLVTVYLNKKGYFNPAENVDENIEN